MTKVLIVDDNKNNRLTIRLLLEEYNDISVFEADNGKKAVETVKFASPDIILMDIMMPVMDGIEATEEIRKIDKNAMIIAISALSDDEHKIQMLKTGAEDYITKPINEELFKARMNNYISILEHRRARERERGAINLFSKDIYLKKTAFIVEGESGLAEFWEQEMPLSKNDNLCDAIRATYNAGLYLLKTNKNFQIISEENDDTIFFSIVGLKNFIAQDIRDIFAKENSVVALAVKSDEISISIPKTLTLLQIAAKEKMTLDEGDEKILRMTHIDKISANKFATELAPDIMDKLEKLEENEDKLDTLVYELETKGDFSMLARLSSEINIYANAIDSLYEFKNLAYALATLAKFITSIKEDVLETKNKDKLCLILRSILADLANWRKTIFVDRATEDIHYLDSSLLSSCLQAELIFKNAALAEEDEGLELF